MPVLLKCDNCDRIHDGEGIGWLREPTFGGTRVLCPKCLVADEDYQIEAQLVELQEYAAKEKLEIVASLCEAKTAKEPVEKHRLEPYFRKRKIFNHTFNSMDNEALKIKKLKSYRNAFWAFLILTYVIGRAGEMIKESGGTNEGTAIFIVAVQAISPVVMIFCGVMWIKIKREMSKAQGAIKNYESK